jgi:hypothetical protein
MYRYRHRFRVILLSLGVVFGYGSAVAHLVWHHGHYGRHDDGHGWGDTCTEWPWSAEPVPNGTPAPKHVQ